MNWGSIRSVIGRLLLLEAALLLLPILTGLIYREGLPGLLPYLASMAVLGICGGLLLIRAPRHIRFYDRDGFVSVALSWFALSFFGALPFVWSGAVPSLLDAVFETASGFTTTGSTILTNVEALPHSLLFWRSFTHLIGGMGVLVLAMAILPGQESTSVHLMKAEVPGPVFGKLVSRMHDTARILYLIYLGMTAILVLLLMLCGMNLFDALIHGFGAAGTGGFSNYNASVGHFSSPLIEFILAVSMILFGVNFNLYFLFLMQKKKRWVRSEELNYYLLIILGATLAITANLTYRGQMCLQALRDSFFSVSSIITTTGYGTADFAAWPLFSRSILLLLMFIGACAGSTGGGFKVSRLAIMIKSAALGTRKMREPHRVLPLRYEDKFLNTQEVGKVLSYFATYCCFLIISVLILSLDLENFDDAFSAVMATFNNIGPGLGSVGPTANFAHLSALSKIVLLIGMIAGRLEIYPVLALISLVQKRYRASGD